jgi:hypothetical protein
MNFRTEIPIASLDWNLDHRTKLMVYGSCFAERIGSWFNEYRFQINLNSHGIIFHPIALARGIQRTIDALPYSEQDLVCNHGMYASFDHHGSFSADNADNALAKMNSQLSAASTFLKSANVMVVTWGSAWAYEHVHSGRIVANCHKLPQADFRKVLVDHEAIYQTWFNVVHALRQLNPAMRFVFTVSPVRYLRDGAHGNQLSKAQLLLAAECLNESLPNVSYFPAYEIVLDELRDYRFYSEDMLHPSQQAIDYIIEKFQHMYLSDACKKTLAQMDALVKFLRHRPLHIAEAEWNLAKAAKMKQMDELIQSVS